MREKTRERKKGKITKNPKPQFQPQQTKSKIPKNPEPRSTIECFVKILSLLAIIFEHLILLSQPCPKRSRSLNQDLLFKQSSRVNEFQISRYYTELGFWNFTKSIQIKFDFMIFMAILLLLRASLDLYGFKTTGCNVIPIMRSKEQDARFSSEPHISQVVRVAQASGAFALFASDGLWDVITISAKKASQLVLQAKERYSSDKQDSAQKIANYMLNEARKLHTKDNTSLVYVDFDTARALCKYDS